ncbi:cupredoxin domain-containing protein [Ferruginibacter lapsinanis]|uniref:cupredoxin domain-containing protein n=1 Tax=Ferruginibacter lapsinanis TaxID=563172 RepID=UPI001E32E19C|nr:cupredoxin domain-containing protein [Ferruginibacter lapsinanis]UEG49513.1 cupredoxin domain-containing protein [Ferruginibacter lapsinanis]
MKKIHFISILLLLSAVTIINFGCKKDSTTTTVPTGGGPTEDVSISGSAFSPSVLTISKGTTVTWENHDAMSHTVTSDDGTSFNSGTLGTHGTFSFKFNTAGTYNYHCSFHSSMTASVVVNP